MVKVMKYALFLGCTVPIRGQNYELSARAVANTLGIEFVDISDFIDGKLEIMGIYESEFQSDPLPRGKSAISALARFRGATIGTEYAEAFMLIREIG